MSAETTSDADPAFEELLEHLRVVRSADFTGYKRPSLRRLVGRRMDAVGLTDYRAYQDLLEVDPAEFARLFDTLLINVTAFFRDASTWDVVRDRAVPELLAGLDDDAPVRVWSAACATGQEAYTWVVLLGELLGPEAFLRRVKVYATDIDEAALQVARAARYPAESVAALAPDVVDRWFLREADEVVVRPEYRSCVIFGRHDLIQDAPISRIDLLSCRNALMYFNHDTQTRVLERLSYALRDRGVLLLGRAEMLLTRGDAFVPLDLSQRLFVKNRPGPRALRLGYGPRGRDGEVALDLVAQAAFAHAPEPQLVLDDAGLLSLVNDSAVRALGLSRDDVGLPFAELLLATDPVDLRRAVSTCASTGSAIEVAGLSVTRGGSTFVHDVHLVPLTTDDGRSLGVQLTFVDVTRDRALQAELVAAQNELETAYEELQSANEELETTNEELQSAVEELETTNEELQSTNEELETMNEELQSTNEELQTLNDELRIRTGEVNQVNAFLESILSSLRGAVVVVDRDLVVRVWNEQAERTWGLRAYEAQGRPLLDLDIGLPVQQLRGLLAEVVVAGVPHRELVVRARDRFGREIDCTVSASALQDGYGGLDGAILLIDERSPEQAPGLSPSSG